MGICELKIWIIDTMEGFNHAVTNRPCSSFQRTHTMCFSGSASSPSKTKQLPACRRLPSRHDKREDFLAWAWTRSRSAFSRRPWSRTQETNGYLFHTWGVARRCGSKSIGYSISRCVVVGRVATWAAIAYLLVRGVSHRHFDLSLSETVRSSCSRNGTRFFSNTRSSSLFGLSISTSDRPTLPALRTRNVCRYMKNVLLCYVKRRGGVRRIRKDERVSLPIWYIVCVFPSWIHRLLFTSCFSELINS